MAKGPIGLGPTGTAVARNVARLRKAQGLSLAALSEALDKAGHKLSAYALCSIENALKPNSSQRRVSVDDLAALAAVLGVSPSALLLPVTDEGCTPVEITGVGVVEATAAWAWADGRAPLLKPDRPESDQQLHHQLYSRPHWLRASP